MDNKFALDLLAGSRAIDQMRKDIEDFAPMLEGLVRQALSRRSSLREINLISYANDCRWSVQASIGNINPSLDFFKIEVCVGAGKCVFAYPKVNAYRFPASDVLIVHGSMDTLIPVLRRVVPELKKEFSPFYEAADISK